MCVCVLCCVVVCCAALCCIVLCCAVFCYVLLCYVLLCFVMVCMYVCMHACMYVYIYIYIYIIERERAGSENCTTGVSRKVIPMMGMVKTWIVFQSGMVINLSGLIYLLQP